MSNHQHGSNPGSHYGAYGRTHVPHSGYYGSNNGSGSNGPSSGPNYPPYGGNDGSHGAGSDQNYWPNTGYGPNFHLRNYGSYHSPYEPNFSSNVADLLTSPPHPAPPPFPYRDPAIDNAVTTAHQSAVYSQQIQALHDDQLKVKLEESIRTFQKWKDWLHGLRKEWTTYLTSLTQNAGKDESSVAGEHSEAMRAAEMWRDLKEMWWDLKETSDILTEAYNRGMPKLNLADAQLRTLVGVMQTHELLSDPEKSISFDTGFYPVLSQSGSDFAYVLVLQLSSCSVYTDRSHVSRPDQGKPFSCGLLERCPEEPPR